MKVNPLLAACVACGVATSGCSTLVSLGLMATSAAANHSSQPANAPPPPPPTTSRAFADPTPADKTAQTASAPAQPKNARPRWDDFAPSRLESLDRAALVEAALDDLMAKGNRLESSQPDPTEAPVRKPVYALKEEDVGFLQQQVYRPIFEAPAYADLRRTLQKALCAWDVRRSGKKLTKSLGEAVDAKECDAQLRWWEVYSNPALKVAFADVLLKDHPRRAELLDAVRLHAARTRGSHFRRLCYRGPDDREFRGDDYDAETQHTPRWQPSIDAEKAWKEAWAKGVALNCRLSARYIDDVPVEQWSADEVEDARALASAIGPTSPSAKEAKDFLARLSGLHPAPRTTPSRDPSPYPFIKKSDVVAALHARNNGAGFSTVLFYDMAFACKMQSVDKVESDRIVNIQSVCVDFHQQDELGCRVEGYMLESRSEWSAFSAGVDQAAKDIPEECP